ncbi:MAG: hypothetical protein IKR39_10920 [Lachnospiraceae bacterium]|nr:hypothetical protein [Lachnospiraceae bacterium]
MFKKNVSVLLLISVLSLSFIGCTKETVSTSDMYFPEERPLVTSTSVSASSESTETSAVETSVSFDEKEGLEVESIDYKLRIINDCKADIGLVCMIDPVSAEQMDVGPLPDGKILTMDFNGWPGDVTKLALAFYNNAGKLVSTTEVDITGVQSTVTVSLSGEGNIEHVKGEVN